MTQWGRDSANQQYAQMEKQALAQQTQLLRKQDRTNQLLALQLEEQLQATDDQTKATANAQRRQERHETRMAELKQQQVRQEKAAQDFTKAILWLERSDQPERLEYLMASCKPRAISEIAAQLERKVDLGEDLLEPNQAEEIRKIQASIESQKNKLTPLRKALREVQQKGKERKLLQEKQKAEELKQERDAKRAAKAKRHEAAVVLGSLGAVLFLVGFIGLCACIAGLKHLEELKALDEISGCLVTGGCLWAGWVLVRKAVRKLEQNEPQDRKTVEGKGQKQKSADLLGPEDAAEEEQINAQIGPEEEDLERNREQLKQLIARSEQGWRKRKKTLYANKVGEIKEAGIATIRSVVDCAQQSYPYKVRVGWNEVPEGHLVGLFAKLAEEVLDQTVQNTLTRKRFEMLLNKWVIGEGGPAQPKAQA